MRIYLIGFMGSGKSHWANIWSKEYAMSCIDIDNMIENEEQLSVDKIFEKKGEVYFRNIESAALKNTIHQENAIVACGGGAPCYFDNMEWMNQHGITIYLRGTPRQLYENLYQEIDKRPMLKKVNLADLNAYIENKLTERIGFYQQAKYMLSLESLQKDSIEHVISSEK